MGKHFAVVEIVVSYELSVLDVLGSSLLLTVSTDTLALTKAKMAWSWCPDPILKTDAMFQCDKALRRAGMKKPLRYVGVLGNQIWPFVKRHGLYVTIEFNYALL